MACLDSSSSSPSSSSDHTNKTYQCPPMSPRISFSNDFAESQYLHQLHHQQQVMRNPRDQSPPTSDFEFSVTNNYSMSMMTTADELFCKGQFLPFKPSHNKTTTLREELLVGDDQELPLRRPKTSTRWKGLLGLKKSHIGSKKNDNKTSATDAFEFTGTVE